MATSETIVDISTTRRLEWEVSKDRFSQCEIGRSYTSPNFTVKVESQISNWRFNIKLEEDRGVEDLAGQIFHIDGIGVNICLSLLPGDVSLKAVVEGIGIKNELGYRPGNPYKNIDGNSKMVSKIEDFNGRTASNEDRSCAVYAGPREDSLALFNTNKITVQATVRYYVDTNEYIKKNKREETFVTHIRSISDLDTLADFTVICGDREFKCHRNILASRSTVFNAMIVNDQFVENRQTSVTIENASPDMVEAMLEFISKGGVPSDIQEKAIDLIDLADRYDLQDLMEICESYLVDNLTVESVIETLIAFDLHIPNSEHRQKILDFIKEEAAEVVRSSHWRTFMEKYPDLVTEIVLSLAPIKTTAN